MKAGIIKHFLILSVMVVLALPLSARDKFDDFSANVTKENLKYFAKDLGGILGSGTFTTGRVLGWGGFQVGPRGAVAFKLDDKNTALGDPDKVGHIIMPWIQADIGMPWKIDAFIRAGTFNGLTMSGGGLRWGIFRPVTTDYSFQAMVVASAHSAVGDGFSAAHYAGNVVLSMTMKHFTPYVAAGVDNTKVTVKDASAVLNGQRENVVTPRYTAGLNFKLPLYLDLSLAGHYANYGPGGEASLSLRF
ncbi:hypothetical protein Dip518_000132 [Parelusimicrobium proximum]|uniref:hypothetical protein n=1 Tax=Parelusimicrobium proximum TaxID=3228953 RepID=UPI003D175959